MENPGKKAIVVLKFAALFALFICVLSDIDMVAIGHRFCDKEKCDQDEWKKCVSEKFEDRENVFIDCVRNSTDSEPEDPHKFFCEDAAPDQFKEIVNCYYKNLVDEYVKDEVDKVLPACTDKCELPK